MILTQSQLKRNIFLHLKETTNMGSHLCMQRPRGTRFCNVLLHLIHCDDFFTDSIVKGKHMFLPYMPGDR